jgi:hypothetical protein
MDSGRIKSWRLSAGRGTVPRWIKLAYTAFLCLLIPVYWHGYGPANFLWACDIALFVTLVALWRENAVLNSMMVIGVLPIEAAWTLDLITGSNLFGMATYMFEAERPLFLRGLSLFHVAMPVLFIFLLRRLGYDRRALVFQTLLVWLVLLLTFLLTGPADNINLVFGPGRSAQTVLHPVLYLALEMILVPAVVCLPMHLLVRWCGGRQWVVLL